MTEESTHEDQLARLREELAGITECARELKRNLVGAHALAATPEGRTKMVAIRKQFADWRQLLASATRELAEIDRVLEKALKRRWGFRA